MTAVLSHECRNILQRISVNAELIALDVERLPDNELALKGLANIQNSGSELGTLLEEVRDYAAPVKLDISRCCVAEVWKSAWDSLSESRNGRDVELIESVNIGDTVLDCDRFRIEQVFRNLFENSLSACSDPVRIEVSATEFSRADSIGIRVTVSDNGPGLTNEQRQRVFEPFFTTKSNGTGLGMSIVKRITEAHRGDIGVVNGYTSGAAFSVTLPKRMS